jgi:hypothetical protein
MRGKAGLVIGLGIGYVLGTRAGRERYEQIKTQWLKVWHLDPVQKQVTKVKAAAADAAKAVPGVIWNGVKKVSDAVQGPGTPGQRLDAGLAEAQKASKQAAAAAESAVATAEAKVADAAKPKSAPKAKGSGAT